MKLRWVAMLAASLLWGMSAWAGSILYSSFDASTEGWSITSPQIPGGGGTPLAQVASGGVGGSGFVWTEDTADGRLFFKAPPSWAGDYYRGSISFDLREGFSPGFPYNPYTLPAGHEPVIMIEGGGPRLFYFGGTGAGPDWTFNLIGLVEGPAWNKNSDASPVIPPTLAELQATLSGITAIYINADWVSRYYGKLGGDFGHDVTSLDEVRLTPIPEPAGYLLAAVGLLLLVLRRRAAA